MIHNALSRGGVSAAVKNFLGVQDPESGVERFGETLTPVLNLWEQPEGAYLRREGLYSAVRSVGPVAGSNSVLALRNDSNELLLMVTLGACNAAYFVLVIANIAAEIVGAAASALACTNRDTRWRLGTGEATSRARSLAYTVAGSGGSLVGLHPANETFRYPVVVGPGASLLIESQAVNIGMTGFIQFSERQLYPAEAGKFGVGA